MREDGHFCIPGAWGFDSESIRHEYVISSLDDYVALQYKAASVNAVMRPEGGSAFLVVATPDG